MNIFSFFDMFVSCKFNIKQLHYNQMKLNDLIFFSCHILGNAGQCLGYEFYRVPDLSEILLSTIFTNLQYLPDFRTKIFINILVFISDESNCNIAIIPIQCQSGGA